MKFENAKVWGLENAIIGMRLPMSKGFEEAKSNCDSQFNETTTLKYKDLDLCRRLIKADEKGDGTPNSKFLRMIHVQVAVTAPLYVFKELDTYKVGTVANSTSTMHKLASTPITIDCFEMDDFEEVFYNDKGIDISTKMIWEAICWDLEQIRQKYNETKDKRYWKELIRLLPESWLQTRMLDLNYATLRSIYSWRIGHKLTEWHRFCDWIESLPYAKELLTSGGC